jgi:predicted dehydrogenase
MTDRIKIGLIGAGANTKLRHIPGFEKIDGVTLVAVSNRSRESSQKVADAYNIPQVFDSWIELLEDPAIDAVMIGTWPYLHHAATVRALSAGKHVLCEARMASNAREAREMYKISLAHPELVAQIVPSPMTLGVDATIQRLIAEGYLGDIISIEIRDSSGEFVDRSRPFHWRESREYSGNNIMSLGIWYEALMRWVGMATQVTAMGKTFIPMRPGSDVQATDIPDHLDVIGTMACGAQLHMQLSTVTGVGGSKEALLFGTEGTLRFSSGKLYGAKRSKENLEELAIPDNEAGEWRVEEEFVQAIRGKEEVKLTDFATGVRYMDFVDAVTLSAGSGRSIKLPLAD